MDLEHLELMCVAFESLAGDHPRAEYMRDYMKQRYHNRRQQAIDSLGGKCVRCGSTKNLEFDHINKKKKTFRFSDVNSVSDTELQKELKNCQLLCYKCHKEKTHDAWDYNTPKPKHGTYWMFRKHGCRCKKCTKAYKEKLKEWKSKS